jgi:putative PIN family toxin of toxin-antitoxin system
MRLVIDTDVLVAGLRSAAGASRIIILAVRAGVVVPLASTAIMVEYEAVLKRDEHLRAAGLAAADVDAFLDAWSAHVEPVAPGFTHRPSIKDPGDEKFVEAAINGHADALVTFNVTDYRGLHERTMALSIEVCRPGDILRRLTWRPPATMRSDFRRR